MKIVTADQMAMVDKHAIEKMNISSLYLMQNAGKKIAREVFRLSWFLHHYGDVALFAYKGKNGGDAIVATRYLCKRPYSCFKSRLILLCRPEELTGDSLYNYKRLVRCHPESIIYADTFEKLQELRGFVSDCGIIVDAIFGTGFKGTPKGHAANAISFIRGFNKYVLSIDIPSGVNGNTGEVEDIAVKADTTVTFGLLKRGLICGDGAEHAGKIKVVDIGLPEESINSVESDLECLEYAKMKSLVVKHSENSHKLSFGHAFILAGSTGYTGAAVMASQAALRAGCGMVTLGCPGSLHDIFAVKLTEVIIKPLCETEVHTLHEDCIDSVLETMEKRKCNVMVIGPGIGIHASTTKLVAGLIRKSPYPVVIDADALNAVAQINPEIFLEKKSEIVITPHPGEFGRLTNVSPSEIQSDRFGYAKQFAKKYGVITVLKGKNTVICSPDGDTYVNITGNSILATAGTGDVLAGMIGSFIAQGIKPLDAACKAVYFHGIMGDIAIRKFGKRGLIASDLIYILPRLIK